MSSAERPELRALDELEAVLSHITDEVASWRRRALKAEGHRAELGDFDMLAASERISDLERENAELHERLQVARRRVEALLQRLEFMEEQVTTEERSP